MTGHSTAPFHTFAPIRTGLTGEIADALEASENGDDGLLIALWKSDEELRDVLTAEGCDLSEGRGACTQTDSMLLIVALSTTDLAGNRLRPYDDGRVRERLGRFPWGDGNPLTYFRAWATTPVDADTDVLGLVEALDTRLSTEARGHDRFESGEYAVLHGWLDHEEARTLERALSKGVFVVSADEPLDGGVADVARNLTMAMRSAQREGAGILHYSH